MATRWPCNDVSGGQKAPSWPWNDVLVGLAPSFFGRPEHFQVFDPFHDPSACQKTFGWMVQCEEITD